MTRPTQPHTYKTAKGIIQQSVRFCSATYTKSPREKRGYRWKGKGGWILFQKQNKTENRKGNQQWTERDGFSALENPNHRPTNACCFVSLHCVYDGPATPSSSSSGGSSSACAARCPPRPKTSMKSLAAASSHTHQGQITQDAAGKKNHNRKEGEVGK